MDRPTADRARRLGRAVHAVLCACLGVPPTDLALDVLARQALEREGIDPAGPEGEASSGEVRTLVEQGLATPLLRAALGTTKRRVEAEVFAHHGGVAVLGRADLVFEGPDGEGLTVVDFKTDRVPVGADGSALQKLCEAHGYDRQVAAYANALRLATGRPVAHAYVLFLAAGQATEVRPAHPDSGEGLSDAWGSVDPDSDTGRHPHGEARPAS